MLETVLDYSLQDLMLFSPEVYFRSLALYNQNIWPAQFIAALTSVYLGYLILGKPATSHKTIGIILALAWAWCGLIFHITHYSSINWFATVYGGLFLAQACLLLWAVFKTIQQPPLQQDHSLINLAGKATVIFGLFIYPFLPLLTNSSFIERQTWQEGQIFGLFPAPTLTVTIGIALMSQNYPKPLLIIPLLYAFIEFLSAYLLGSLTSGIFVGLIILLLIYFVKKTTS